MGLLDTLRSLFGGDRIPEIEDRDAADANTPRSKNHRRPRHGGTVSSRAAGGGRLSLDSPESRLLFGSAFSVEPPTSPETAWQQYNLDADALSRVSATKLVQLIVDLSPDVSRALWDYLRLCNPGYEITALQPGSDDPHEDGQRALDDFIRDLEERHGALDVIIGRLFIGGWIRGAFLAELVLDQSATEPREIATPDPGSVRFRKRSDPEIGEYWQMGQWQGGEFVVLSDDETIRYIPVDPLPGNPYGRPLISPALFTTLFLIGLLHDLRRVVAQQGYPRLDVEVDLERLQASMPADIEIGSEEYRKWINATLDEIAEVYNNLEPDDAYVHTDVVKVNRPVGAIDASSLSAVDGLIRALERQAVRALKTMPILMGSNETGTETHATKQWEIMTAGITTLQHYVENLLGRLFELALQAQGILAKVEVRFAQLREAERLMNAQTEAMEMSNAYNKYLYGWISHEQAAQEGAGVEVPAEDAPLISAGVAGGGFVSVEGESGRTYRRWVPDSHVGSREPHVVELRLITGSRIEVEGDAGDLPAVPAQSEIGEEAEDEQEDYYDTWDDLMPEYEGLLRAEFEEEPPDDEEGDAANSAARRQSRLRPSGVRHPAVRGPVRQGGEGEETVWVWEQNTKRYRNTETGRFVGADKMVELRDEFTDLKKEHLSSLADQLDAGDLTIDEWTEEFRRNIRETFTDQYVMAKGGRGAMTQADWGRLGRMCRDQYEFLDKFAGDILADEDLTLPQVKVRSRLYVESSTQSFERGKAASYGFDPSELPQQPADGNQICRANCRCVWVISELEDRWEAVWTLNPIAEHCDTCEFNSTRWAPYIILKPEARQAIAAGGGVYLKQSQGNGHRKQAFELDPHALEGANGWTQES